MAVPPGRCISCGEKPHGDAPCGDPAQPRPSHARAKGPCDCLPQAPDDWPACPTCGLPQRPGRDSCGFCGSRWRTDTGA